MQFEGYQTLFEEYENGPVLRAGGRGMQLNFPCNVQKDRKYRLFVVGETTLFYQWKDEPDGPLLYRAIDDALESENAREARYCLRLHSAKPEKYVRWLYKKTLWPPRLSYLDMRPVPDDWTCGVWAKAENLQIEEGGYLRMRIEIRRLHEGKNRHDASAEADESYVIDFPAGTYDWQKIETALHIPVENTAHVGVWFEGVGYSGKFWLEHAFLQAPTGENLLPEFDAPASDEAQFDWLGMNISRKEWPEFAVTLNGEEVFRGEIFERCHRCSEWEIDLPARLLGERNDLKIALVSDYHDPLPYKIEEIRLLDQGDKPVSLIAVCPCGTLQEGAYALIRTKNDNAKVFFETESPCIAGESEYLFAKAGLHGIRFACKQPGANAAFTLRCEDATENGEIPLIVDRTPDGIITGTGDMIYVEQRMDYVEEFLSWYVANGVGNLFTIRPTYRWSGSRILNPEVWELVVRVLNELGLKYALMLDGRELPGLNANPDVQQLSGEGFLGRQTHERDGAAFYWGIRNARNSMMDEQYIDAAQRIFREDEAHCNVDNGIENFLYKGDDIYQYRDPDMERDYKKARDASVEFLRRGRHDAPRHTGPSVMFKYFFDAGYKWVGAETMYGSMEPIMAFQRGAVWANGIKDMGVHHAVQWSSSPQDAPEHFRRYRLALYVSYMQGATQINTEEGLWHLEEYYSHFHRFSAGCAGHMRQQQDFYRYVASHSRTGNFYAPMALIHGRYDGWHAFTNGRPWGWQDMPNSDAEKSWDLLKVFYPLSKPGDALYIHGCETDRAVGYHTGMPMGNVDILPAEKGLSLCKNYRALAFMGYHCAQKEDFAKLGSFVQRGGKLLLTRAHLCDTTDAHDVQAGKLHESAAASILGGGAYADNHVQGISVTVCKNAAQPDRVLAWTDEGTPFVCEYDLGFGSVILINALAYPAHPAVRKTYENLLETTMRGLISKEHAWLETGDDMGSAVYDQADGSRHIYAMPVDWFRPEALLRKATLRVGAHHYHVELPFGVMTKCVVRKNCAAWPHSEDGEVLSIEDGAARVQGRGQVVFSVARDGVQREISVDFSQSTLQSLQF